MEPMPSRVVLGGAVPFVMLELRLACALVVLFHRRPCKPELGSESSRRRLPGRHQLASSQSISNTLIIGCMKSGGLVATCDQAQRPPR